MRYTPVQGCIFGVLFLILFFLVGISLLYGKILIAPNEFLSLIIQRVTTGGSTAADPFFSLIFTIRVPRTIAVVLVGASLSGCGVVLQSVYRNPLVSPYILGISTGAGFGAAIAILWTGNLFFAQVSALLCGLFVALLTWGIDKFTQVLAGLAMGTLFASLTVLVKWYADPFTVLPFITFWLFGSCSRVSTDELLLFGPVILSLLLLLFCMRWQLNLITTGYDHSLTLGVDARLVRAVLLLSVTFIVAICVSLCGIIGWIGLVIPHIGRLLVGADHIVLLPFSLLCGAVFLLIIDLFIRICIPGEFPIGVIIGLLGAPVFAFILWKSQKS